MNELVRWKPNVNISRRIEEALAAVETPPLPERRVVPVPLIHSPRDGGRVATPDAPPLLAMPRVCAVTGKPYMSYYLQRNGRYRYSRSGQLSKAIFREVFAPNGGRGFVLGNQDIEEETCAWCGTSGIGGIECPICRSFTCWGTVIDNRLWRCHGACGHAAELERRSINQIGVIPASK